MRLITATILSSALLSACLLLGCAATDGEQTRAPEPAPESTVVHIPEPTATHTPEATAAHAPEPTATHTPEATVNAHSGPQPPILPKPRSRTLRSPRPLMHPKRPGTPSVRPSTYLEATVEPCVGLEGSSVDPCERRGGDIDNDPFSSVSGTDVIIELAPDARRNHGAEQPRGMGTT